MRQLPGTGCGEDGQLDHCPADDAGVGGFRLVAELGLTLLRKEKIVSTREYFLGWMYEILVARGNARTGVRGSR
jgi:hypothetical protein